MLSSTKEISDLYTIPQELLAKTLQQMARLEYIDAVQGPHGGYRVHSTMSKISLTKFIEDLEGPMGMVDCIVASDCIQLNNCNIRQPINRKNDNIRSIFNSINLSEITH